MKGIKGYTDGMIGDAMEDMLPGPSFMQAVDAPAVQAFIDAHDVENERAARRETPDLIKVLGRVPARRALERVAAAASGDRVAA